jgi:hypothetical protein
VALILAWLYKTSLTMKKYSFLLIMLCTSIVGLQSTEITAQITVNIGVQPNWGPVGYDRVDYYYLPDIDAYYDVPNRQFIYQDGSNWVFRSSLPVKYRNYDLYHGYKVVVNEPKPYLRNDVHRNIYARYQGDKSQPFIRDYRKEKRYGGNGNNNEGRGNKGGGKEHKEKKGGRDD